MREKLFYILIYNKIRVSLKIFKYIAAVTDNGKFDKNKKKLYAPSLYDTISSYREAFS